MTTQQSINISGLVVHTRPENVVQVQAQLDNLPGVEVHAATDEGRFVVTVEKEDDAEMMEACVQIHNLKHVINTSLVYQHNEPIDPEPINASEISTSAAEINS